MHLVQPVLRALQQVGHDDDALLRLVELVNGRLQVEVVERGVVLRRPDGLEVPRQQLDVVPQFGLRPPRLPDARVDGLDRGSDQTDDALLKFGKHLHKHGQDCWHCTKEITN